MSRFIAYWVPDQLNKNLISENFPYSIPSFTVISIAYREMSVKDKDSNSWYVHCNHLLYKYMYKLPNIYNLKQSTNSKETLKTEIKHNIDYYVHQSWVEEGSSKSSLSTYMTAVLEVGWSIIIPELLDELTLRRKS